MPQLRKLRFLLTSLGRWMADSPARARVRRSAPVHVVFGTFDHYEPGTMSADEVTEVARVADLMERYPRLVEHHRDAAGNLPGRTWFFPPHYHRLGSLKGLVRFCERGFGEIELHLHHGKLRPDDSEHFERTVNLCLDEYSRFGIFGRQDGRIRYGFIHGDWALDNSRHGQFCGVNNEIELLIKTGCYADFTFPSRNEANPSQINSLYYAIDDPARPKSHDRGIPVRVGGENPGGLMIVQGPLHPYRMSRSPLSLRIFGDAINGAPAVDATRVAAWVKTGIHVEGRPEVVFVKTHAHGAEHPEALLGAEMDFIFRFLEENFNDGSRFILHYTTAREMVNIIKALEAGESAENLEEYRNYLICPPEYDSSPDIQGASEALTRLVGRTYV